MCKILITRPNGGISPKQLFSTGRSQHLAYFRNIVSTRRNPTHYPKIDPNSKKKKFTKIYKKITKK
jgi:hypothetical protein